MTETAGYENTSVPTNVNDIYMESNVRKYNGTKNKNPIE